MSFVMFLSKKFVGFEYIIIQDLQWATEINLENLSFLIN